MNGAGVVVVGAGQAAAQLAMSLRQKGYAGPVTLLGDEPHQPYERPPLSKSYLTGATETGDLPLRPASFWKRKDVTVRTATSVTGLDRVRRGITLADGTEMSYGHLVLATGAAPRRIEGCTHVAGVHVLRTRDDADRLKADLAGARGVVVVGAGFVGLEVAAIAREGGAAVTVLESSDRAMARVVSRHTAAELLAEHRRRGVDVRLGEGLAAGPDAILTSGGRVRGVLTSTGAELDCDVLVLGIGVVPRTELAEAAGLACADGILVDATLRTSDPHVSAIGDCAAFPCPRAGGAVVRLEAVQNAVDHARCVADRLTGTERRYNAVPWFWTSQFQLKLQVAGLVTGHDTAVMRGDPEEGEFSVFCFTGSTLLGVESVNRPADHLLARALLAGEHRLTPDVVADPQAVLAEYRPVSTERTPR